MDIFECTNVDFSHVQGIKSKNIHMVQGHDTVQGHDAVKLPIMHHASAACPCLCHRWRGWDFWYWRILTNYKFLPNTVILAKPSIETAALLGRQRYSPVCSTFASLTISVPLSTSLPLGILPLTFDQVTGSGGVTRQKRRKELPRFTDNWEGVTSTRGTRLKEKGIVNVLCSMVVLHNLSLITSR